MADASSQIKSCMKTHLLPRSPFYLGGTQAYQEAQRQSDGELLGAIAAQHHASNFMSLHLNFLTQIMGIMTVPASQT